MCADTYCASKCNPDSYAYEYTQCYTNGYSEHYGYGYSYGYIDADAQRYGNSYSHGYGHGETNAYRKAQRYSEATFHTAAAPLRELAWRLWGAHVSHVLVSASTPKRTFQKFQASDLQRTHTKSPR